MAQRTNGLRILLAAVIAFGGLVIGLRSAEGSPMAISSCYTGDCSAFTGSVVVTITDDTGGENDGTGDVKFVIENLTNGFVDEFGLRYEGGLSGAPAIESFSSSSGRVGMPRLLLGSCQNDNSGQGLNVCFDFANQQSRINPGERVAFFVDSASAAFLASHFDAARGYAHIQGLPRDGSVKLVIGTQMNMAVATVPEPGSLVLLGSGLAAAAAAMRRKKKRDAQRTGRDVIAESSAPVPPSAD
jgi:hypothetical protein